MVAREAALVALAVGGNVLGVPLAELLDGLLDHLVATGLPHRLGTVVGVGTGAVPVTHDRLRVEGQHNPSYLSDPLKPSVNIQSEYTEESMHAELEHSILIPNKTDLEDVAGHPNLVTGSYSDGRADLELPLFMHIIRFRISIHPFSHVPFSTPHWPETCEIIPALA